MAVPISARAPDSRRWPRPFPPPRRTCADDHAHFRTRAGLAGPARGSTTPLASRGAADSGARRHWHGRNGARLPWSTVGAGRTIAAEHPRRDPCCLRSPMPRRSAARTTPRRAGEWGGRASAPRWRAGRAVQGQPSPASGSPAPRAARPPHSPRAGPPIPALIDIGTVAMERGCHGRGRQRSPLPPAQRGAHDAAACGRVGWSSQRAAVAGGTRGPWPPEPRAGLAGPARGSTTPLASRGAVDSDARRHWHGRNGARLPRSRAGRAVHGHPSVADVGEVGG